jgi:SanA protein
VLLLCGTAMSYTVGRAARQRIFAVEDAPVRDVAIVFGAGVHPDGTLAAPLEDRVLTAVELYRAHKVRKLLMSGDNSRRSYDEPTAMMEHAVALGVSRADIALDYAGFHTYDTCYRAGAVFDVHSATLITQRFHLARAIFTCRALGVDAVGVPADRQAYARRLWYEAREQIARARAFIQVRICKPLPRYLGPKMPI